VSLSIEGVDDAMSFAAVHLLQIGAVTLLYDTSIPFPKSPLHLYHMSQDQNNASKAMLSDSKPLSWRL
jgi:hypothetical protein